MKLHKKHVLTSLILMCLTMSIFIEFAVHKIVTTSTFIVNILYFITWNYFEWLSGAKKCMCDGRPGYAGTQWAFGYMSLGAYHWYAFPIVYLPQWLVPKCVSSPRIPGTSLARLLFPPPVIIFNDYVECAVILFLIETVLLN